MPTSKTPTQPKQPDRMPLFVPEDFCKGSNGSLHGVGPTQNCAGGKIMRLTGSSASDLATTMRRRFVAAMKRLNPSVQPYNPEAVVSINDDSRSTYTQIAQAMNAVIASLGYRVGQSKNTLALAAKIKTV